MFNVRVEYDSTPIRHIAVQCPECNKWFHGWDVVKDGNAFDILKYEHDINFVVFKCPICEKEFGGIQHADKPYVKECGYPEIYDGCLERKEVWV